MAPWALEPGSSKAEFIVLITGPVYLHLWGGGGGGTWMTVPFDIELMQNASPEFEKIPPSLVKFLWHFHVMLCPLYLPTNTES